MAQENSNSTMEMGTSDQVLVDTKRKKTLKYVIGGVAMLTVIGVVIALVVTQTGGDGSVAEFIKATTEGPTAPISTPTTVEPMSTSPGSTEPPTTQTGSQLSPLELEEIIDGVFSPPSFNATWTSGNEVLFKNTYGDLIRYDVDTDTRTVLVGNSSQILQQSSRVMTMSPDGNHIVLAYNVAPVYRHSFLARYKVVDIVTGNEVDILPSGLDADAAFLQNFLWGSNGTSLAFVYLNNIYYQANLNDKPRQISTSGQFNVVYNGIPDWVYEEEVFGSSNAMWFSNDGNRMAYVTFNDTNVRVMRVPHFGVPGNINYQYTQYREIRYPKVGTVNPVVSVNLYDLTTNTNNVYEAPADLDQPILKNVRFVSNTAIAMMWTNRVQTTFKVVLCTAGTTACTQIYSYTETHGWIDNVPLMFNDAGSAFITILPQDVSGVLYKQIVQVSQGVATAAWTLSNRINTAHTVLDILLWAPNDIIWYKATSESDSAEQHIYSVGADGVVECFTCNITREDGQECLFNGGSISTSGQRIIVNCAGPGVPQIFVYNSNGSRVRVWDSGNDLSESLNNRNLPVTIRMAVPITSTFSADVQIHAPADYASRTNVPLLVFVYGGPDTALVTKQWNLDWDASLVSRWGVAVANIDGRGSGLRDVNNLFALNRRLGTFEVDDQISAVRYLHENLSWLDSNRTCIWGWSYGGYAATKALAEGGDVFRCAAAVAPVVDWKYYDSIYTERYMDLPANNPEGYTASSLLTDEVAEAFRNKSYFLIHGTADDNVHFQHAMLFSRLLQRRDVYFTQMSYTDEDHSLLGVRPHLYHALEKFLQEHML